MRLKSPERRWDARSTTPRQDEKADSSTEKARNSLNQGFTYFVADSGLA